MDTRINFKSTFSFILILSFLNFFVIINCQKVSRYDPKIFHQKTSPNNYANWADPKDLIDVDISIKILKFGPLDEKKSQSNLLLHLFVSWNDPRLSLSNLTTDNNLYPLEIDSTDLKRIWKPKLHLTNSQPIIEDILSDKLPGQISAIIYANGEVLVMKKAQIGIGCKLNSNLYPMDTQRCSLEIESSVLSTRNMNLKWSKTNVIETPKKLKIGNFDMQDINWHFGSVNHKSNGPYGRLEVSFKLSRQFGTYLLNIYLPSTLFVITSWCSFWLHITGAPARIALVLTTMLTHVSSTKSVRDSLPQTLSITSMDVWIVMCTMFIFAAIIEYATVNYYYYKPTRIQDKKAPETKPSLDNNGNLLDGRNSQQSNYSQRSNESVLDKYWHQAWSKVLIPFNNGYPARRVALQIDRTSRYLFPLTFIFFNILYWSILAIYSKKN